MMTFNLMATQGEITEKEREYFREHGLLYIRNFYDPEHVLAIQRQVHRLIALVIKSHDVDVKQEPFSPKTFDSGLLELTKSHRRLAGIVYDAVKKLPEYFSLACSPIHYDLTKKIFQSEFVGIAHRGFGIRMDHPNEDKFLTHLHQDYHSQVCSPSGIVIWSPLRRVTKEMGPVKLFPGTHKLGILPVVIDGGGSYGQRIVDVEKVANKFESVCPEVEVGDVLVCHMLTLHESTPNRSQHTRWAMISRYFDFNEETGRKHGWRGGIQEGVPFSSVHPELCTIKQIDT